MEISFYHLTRTTLEAALPQMLEKTLERGQQLSIVIRIRATLARVPGRIDAGRAVQAGDGPFASVRPWEVTEAARMSLG